jgi:hypothetical protein
MTPCSARSVLATLACVIICASVGHSQDASPPVLSSDDYIARVEALRAAVAPPNDDPSAAIMSLVGAVPRSWRLAGTGQVFATSTDALRRDVRAWATLHDEAARRRALDHLRTLLSEAASFQRPAPDRAASRALLADILARREFRRVHGPTWLGTLRQRAVTFLMRLLGRVIEPSLIPTLSNVIVYGLIVLAALSVGPWAYRLVRRRPAVQTILPLHQSAPAREWPAWLAEAHKAAALGQWREAVHFSYWCAVTFLEARGAWRPNSARTPREYLRLLPPANEDAVTLGALTRCFERVWYGTDEADAETFAESIANLKKIGCPAA